MDIAGGAAAISCADAFTGFRVSAHQMLLCIDFTKLGGSVRLNRCLFVMHQFYQTRAMASVWIDALALPRKSD
jgi:hypothetical protein